MRLPPPIPPKPPPMPPEPVFSTHMPPVQLFVPSQSKASLPFVTQYPPEIVNEPLDLSKQYKPGDKVYYVNRGKSLAMSTFGVAPLEKGVRLNAAHIDSPRLDLKPNPVYEKNDIAYFKTHYYGGIRKYQWVTTPLAMHGVIYGLGWSGRR